MDTGILFKAVSEIEGKYYSLGMGSAHIIPLPRGIWIDGGSPGLFACITQAAANNIIKDAKRRKRLPIPPNMKVIAVEGKVRSRNGQRVICDTIRLTT